MRENSKFEVRHQTTYDYEADVSLSHHIAYLTPRSTGIQRCLDHRLEFGPKPATNTSHTDHFGNHSAFLTIEGAHRRLEVVASTRVELSPPELPASEATAPWETVRALCSGDSLNPPIEAVRSE